MPCYARCWASPLYVAELDGREEMLAKLTSKLQPWRIRSTLAFAGLYQITHELVKEYVIDEVRNFYMTGFDRSRSI